MMSLREDMLFGAGQVANFVGVSPRKVYHWMERRRSGKTAPPVFDVGGEVCGRISELRTWFSGNRELSTQKQAFQYPHPPEDSDVREPRVE